MKLYKQRFDDNLLQNANITFVQPFLRKVDIIQPENVNPGYFAVGKLGRADLFHLSSLTQSSVNVGC